MDELLEALRTAVASRHELVGELEPGPGAGWILARERGSGRALVLHVHALARGAGLDMGRLRAELVRHARLVHERLLPVLDLGVEPGLAWIAHPHLAQAVRLRTWLERERRLPFLEAVRVLRECAEGLEHAHAAGCFHLELRPESVLWCDTHARLTGLGVRQALLEAGLAPRSSEREPGREDIHALGRLGFEMLVGASPAAGTAPSPARLRAHVPPGLARLVVRCLAPDPLQRPRDMREVLRLLSGLVTPGPAQSAPQILEQAEYLRREGRTAQADELLARADRRRSAR